MNDGGRKTNDGGRMESAHPGECGENAKTLRGCERTKLTKVEPPANEFNRKRRKSPSANVSRIPGWQSME